MHTAPRARRPAVRAAAIAMGLAPIAAAGPVVADTTPQAGGANNIVVATTTAAGATLARTNTQVTQVGGPTVSSTNVADATASDCAGCHATSVAAQVVFVTGAPQYFTPANTADAVNSGCSSCSTFAYAWQYIVPVDGTVHLSPSGQQQVQAISDQIRTTAAATVPATLSDAEALRAQLDNLTAQLAAVVQQEMQLGTVHATGAPVAQVHTDYVPS